MSSIHQTWRASSGRTRRLGACGAVLAVAFMGADLPAAGAQDSSSGAVDVLTADRAEVMATLAALETRFGQQRAEAAAAESAATAAAEAAAAAEARLARAEREVEQARRTVAGYAVEAYMRPPGQDALRVLSLTETQEASYASTVIRILTEERHQVVDELVAKKTRATSERSRAREAADSSRRSANDAQVKLVQLDRLRVEQQQVAAELDDRLDAALAEAAALVALDEQKAEELVAEELALRESGPPSVVPPSADGRGGNPTTGPPVAGPPAPQPRPTTPAPPTTARPTTTTPRTSPTTTVPRTPTTTVPRTPTTTIPTAPGTVTWADVTRVGGIWVHKSIASNVSGLLNAATAAGLNLAGGGYRDAAGQIATRRANCGPTYYDIYEKPASQCTPPTARPGRSMHERGLAIDFTSGGSLITSRSNPAFIWLNENAARFGLYNLPSEPWHWSTNGS
jgi:hypothetical protein